MMLQREKYQILLNNYKDKPFIKVITGLRRSGKSVLLDLFIQRLYEQGIPVDHVLKINFELPENFHINEYQKLTEVVLDWAKGKKGSLYIFLDEVGRVSEWEKAVNGLHAMNAFDIYITGSNADLLSSELSTFLAGRYVEILVHPFSYREFLQVHKNAQLKDYLVFGGLPSISVFNLEYESSMTVLRDSFRSAVLQDVIQRYSIRNTVVLEKLIIYLCSNTSMTFSALSISKYLKSQHVSVTVDTVLNYINILVSAFIVYKAPRYDILGKSIMKTEEKYFIADVGFREAMVGNNTKSIELILETIVYIELIRRGFQVYIGKVDQYEIDFVAVKQEYKEYYQVSYKLESPKTREREFGVYQRVSDSYPKFVISMDEVDFSSDGIIHKNITQFLIDD
ncbi:MAG: ATPase [Firmicutes bacterium HGW-Firmicutes-19]|nr:MAG: ATPase [Firmicutes bacterium HGW-Firmicutes-19]